uniref:Resolvase/invertase-type recombinase catalytic domain-containing protein n=1 Tax=Mycolicibacterium phage Alyssa1 TaxID=3240801 RepID=A0AB39U217_9CAUD
MTCMKVLGRARLSVASEESTSIERQREVIEQWANANGHTVVGWAEDIDVSGRRRIRHHRRLETGSAQPESPPAQAGLRLV